MDESVKQLLSGEFVFGTQYYRPPTPTFSEWEGDLLSIRDAGFNTVKIWMMWRWHERVKGVFRWDDSDRIFTLCRELGLKINVNIILDAAPDWLYREHDCHRINHKGERVRPVALGAVYIGGVTPCYDNPQVRAEAERFLRAAAFRYGGHEALLSWDIWNEPRYLTVSNIASPNSGNMECWCEHSLAAYRDWLRERYGSVDELNARLGKVWTDYDTVVPPTRYDDYTEALIWRQWCTHSVSSQISWAYHAVKTADPQRPVHCHAGGCAMVQGAGTDPSDDCANARCVDFYGSSLPCNENPWSAAIICDWIRCVSPYYWINEVYTGSPGWGSEPGADHLCRVTWTALGHGAKGVLYWQYKAERLGSESNGYGMVGLDGSITEKRKTAASIASFLKGHRDLMQALQPVPAEVGILYDMKTDMLSHIEDTASFPYHYKRGIDGVYALFWLNNIPVDWISSEEISADPLSRYKLIYLPAPHMLDKHVAEALCAYVREGGTLVSEASPGLRDEKGWVNARVPNGMLAELFGCTEAKRMERDSGGTIIVSFDGWSAELTSGRVMSELELSTAQAGGIWRDGGCAATLNRYGKGRAILLGTDLGESFNLSKDRQPIMFIEKLCAWLSCAPPVRISGAANPVSAQCMRCERADMLIVMNHGDSHETVQLETGDVFSHGGEWQVAFGQHNALHMRNSVPQLDLLAGTVACLIRYR